MEIKKKGKIEVGIIAKEEGNGEIEVIVKTGNYKHTFIISIPIYKPFIGFTLDHEIYGDIFDHDQSSLIIQLPNEYQNNIGNIKVEIGSSSSILLFNLSQKYLQKNNNYYYSYYHNLESLSSLLIFATTSLSFIDKNEWNDHRFDIKISMIDWFTLIWNKFEEKVNQLLSKNKFQFDIPHALLASKLVKDKEILPPSLTDPLHHLLLSRSEEYINLHSYHSSIESDEDQILFCYSIYSVYKSNSSSNHYMKNAIKYLQSRSLPSIPVICFGWLLPVIYLFSDLPENFILSNDFDYFDTAQKIIDHLESLLLLTDDQLFATFAYPSPPSSSSSSSSSSLYSSTTRTDGVILNGMKESSIISIIEKSKKMANLLTKTLCYSYSPITRKPLNINEVCWISLSSLSSLSSLNDKNNNNNNVDHSSNISVWVNGISSSSLNKLNDIQNHFSLFHLSSLPPFNNNNNNNDNDNNDINVKKEEVIMEEIKEEEKKYEIIFENKNQQIKEGRRGRMMYRISANLFPKSIYLQELSDRGILITRSYQYFSRSNNMLRSSKEDDNLCVIDKNSQILIIIDIIISINQCNQMTMEDSLPAGFQFQKFLSSPSSSPSSPYSSSSPSHSSLSSLKDQNEDENNKEEEGGIERLSDGLIIHILEYLPLNDVLNMEMTCKRFYGLVENSSSIWNSFYNQEYEKDIQRENIKREHWMSDKLYFSFNFRSVSIQEYQSYRIFDNDVIDRNYFEEQSVGKDKVQFYAERMIEGRYRYQYIARASFNGTFVAPPSSLQSIYLPSLCAHSSTLSISIV